MASMPAPPTVLYGRIRDILQAARANVVRTVNTTQAVANWLVGREIVEAQQRGKQRADDGAELLAGLSARLTQDFGRGWSVDNIFASRYQLYLPTVGELQQELVREWRQIVPAEPAKPVAKRRTTQKKVEGKKR